MKRISIYFTATLLLTMFAGILAVLYGQSPVTRSRRLKSEITNADRKAFEGRVREYILSNPEIIQEALVALQAKEDKRKRDSIAENIRRSGEGLYSDALSPVGGNPNGDVSIVVFYDYFCGYCKKTLPALQALIAGDSRLRIIYKEFPILGPQSMIAAKAALAAARQGKFAEFHRLMLESDSGSDEAIKAIASKLGLDYPRFQKDMDDPVTVAAIDRNIRLAESIGVTGTPAYLIGDKFIPGVIDAASLADMVKSERAKTAKPDTEKAATARGVN